MTESYDLNSNALSVSLFKHSSQFRRSSVWFEVNRRSNLGTTDHDFKLAIGHSLDYAMPDTMVMAESYWENGAALPTCSFSGILQKSSVIPWDFRDDAYIYIFRSKFWIWVHMSDCHWRLGWDVINRSLWAQPLTAQRLTLCVNFLQQLMLDGKNEQL